MTIVVPVAITPAGLPLPDPGDRATFSARKLEHLRWASNEYSTGSKALADATYANALEAKANADDVYINTVATAANTAQAALYAGATLWAAGTYALGVVTRSPATGRLFRKTTASSATTLDPSTDPANWTSVKNTRPIITVGTASVTAAAGFDYLLTYAGVVTVTAPAAPASEDTFGVIVANGQADNILNPNGGTVFNVAGTMKIDNAYADITAKYLNSTWRISL